MAYELIISHGGNVMFPAVEEGIQWKTQRKDAPGQLDFKVIADDKLKIEEGDPVRFKEDDENIFYGFIFKMQRDKNQQIKITAYDQKRYLKNKDTYVYENKTASQFIQMVCADFGLQTGSIADTGYVIPTRTESNTTLIDMIQTALDLTTTNTGQMYVLYDDFGKLTLKNIADMKTDLLIYEESAENFDYTSSIDDNTYNKVKITYENDEDGKRDVYIAQDGGHINQWGVLQYYDTKKEGESGDAKANALLNLYNHPTRKLTIKGAFGDNRVRAGSLVVVKLDLGDMQLSNYMMVETCTHKYVESHHSMDFTLRGGEFVGG